MVSSLDGRALRIAWQAEIFSLLTCGGGMLYYLRAVARGVLDVKEVIAGHSPYMAKIFGIVRSWSTSNFRWPLAYPSYRLP